MSVSPFIWMTIIDLIAFLLWAVVSCCVYEKMFSPHKMLLVYGGSFLATSLVRKMVVRQEKYLIQEAVSVELGDNEVQKKCLNIPP